MSDSFDDVDIATHRREARERAVSLLYEAEMKSKPIAETISLLPLAPSDLVVELATGVGERTAELDALLAAALDESWSMSRLAVLDRIVLRLGAYELSHRPEVPTGAIMNEAVELAKYFSGPEAGRFVNGVLSSVVRSTRP